MNYYIEIFRYENQRHIIEIIPSRNGSTCYGFVDGLSLYEKCVSEKECLELCKEHIRHSSYTYHTIFIQ